MTTATATPPLVAPVPTPQHRRYLVRAFLLLRNYWQLTVGAYLALVGITLLTLATPQFIRWIIDQGIGAGNSRLLTWAVLGLLGLTVVRGLFTYWQGRWTEIASQSVAYDLRNAMLERLTHLSFDYHDRTESGQLLSRAMQDVDRIRFLNGRAVLGLVNAIVLLIGTAIALLWMNPKLALLALISMPVLAYQATTFAIRLRPLSLAIQQQMAVLTTRLEQNLRGARIVKAFAQEDREIERFESENRNWFRLSAEAAQLQAVNNPLMDLIANASVVFILWYGGLLVINSQITLGDLIAFTTYLGQMAGPVRRFGMIIPAIAQAGASAERVFEILDAESQVQDEPDAQPLPPVQGHLRFENVSFGYSHSRRVLNGVSFDVKPGQVLALLGPTGSGKSSIINLIPRFYDPSGGRVTIDGYDIRHITQASLRSQIGIVLQESTLFATTIRENIAFGRPDAADEEVIAAAKAAQAHEFITQMANGYDAEVGERGATLSGGQRQRMAIARALLKDPRILILDDATASVDTETERLIQKALARLMEGRTSVIIAQRLSTVRMADLILILEKGRVTGAGTHEELLAPSPLYQRIYAGQLERK